MQRNPHAETGAGWRDKAEPGQRLDPARSVALYRERFIIRRAIPVMLASLKHEEQRAQHLVANRNNRSFVATPDHKGLELRFEHRRGPAGCVGKFAQQTANIRIALAGVA